MVRRLADPRSFERGQAYLSAGAVRSLAFDAGALSAIVGGTSDYQVRLELTPDGLDWSCSCPYGETGEFCKHCVATALAWEEDDEPSAAENGQLLEFLRSQDAAW